MYWKPEGKRWRSPNPATQNKTLCAWHWVLTFEAMQLEEHNVKIDHAMQSSLATSEEQFTILYNKETKKYTQRKPSLSFCRYGGFYG